MIQASVSLEVVLRGLVERRAEPSSREWLGRTVLALGAGVDRDMLLDAFAAAARRLGRQAREPDGHERTELAAAGVTWPLGAWAADELGRILLLLAAATHWADAEVEAVVSACYREGEGREREAVLRALPLLPRPERFLEIGVDAGRSHMQPLFEAIACENPYPARCFPELNFNQMVLKALFVGVAVDRILGLEERRTPELRRMAEAFASERQAAGRSIPPDLWRATGERGRER